MSTVEYHDTCQTAADVAAAARLVRQRRKAVFFAASKPAPTVAQPVKAPEPKVSRLHMAGPASAQFLDVPKINAVMASDVEIPDMPLRSGYSIGSVQGAVCFVSGILKTEMLSHRRRKGVTEPRGIAMFLSRLLTKRSYPEIGRKFDCDHTTVLAAARKYGWMADKLPAYGAPVNEMADAAWALHLAKTA